MNINWKPKAWIAISLGIILQSFTFLYLNRPKLFWFYFILAGVISIIDWKYQTLFAASFSLICPIHAYFVVKNFEHVSDRAWYSKWWGIPVIFVVFYTAFFTFLSVLYEPFTLPAASMQPTINPGNRILVKKLGYRTYGAFGVKLFSKEISSPDLMQRGKLYAFYLPKKNIVYVKRLIATPGDTLAISGNEITINGSVIATELTHEKDQVTVYEQKLGEITHSIQRTSVRPYKDIEKIVIPENSYFFLGDNRDRSSDSRDWGYVTSDRIVGEVIYVFK